MAKFDFRKFMAAVRYEAGEAQKPMPVWLEVGKLFRLKGDEFVSSAYQSLLRREVDPIGLEEYSHRSSSFAGRAFIVCALLASPERGTMPPWLRKRLSDLKKILTGRGRNCI